MLSYLVHRILIMIPTLIAISIVIFTIINLPPGDYFSTYIAELQASGEATDLAKIHFLQEQYGFNRPLWEQYARAKPWVLKSADQFRPGPPPALSSAEWARDYNEVKSLGGTKSTARTAEQTEAVRFWENVNFGPAWQAAARELAMKKELPLAECARLFALLNMSLANAYIVNWDAKYTYNFWRPVTAIRNGDQDGNDATERDAAWTSFNPTPMHPEYPSQATINATIASAVLESVFGPVKAIPFTATDVRDPKRTRQFASLADMAEEQKNVRVWGGVHYRFAIRTSEDVGRKVAAHMIENTLEPVR